MKKRISRKWKWVSGLTAFIVLLGAVGYFNRGALAMLGFDLFFSKKVEKKLEQSYKPLEGRQTAPVAYTDTKPISFLLLGVDQREGESSGRSDTIIYTVVRPKDGAILMVSVPRDTLTEIAGREEKDKINHAYAFGGAKMAVETVELLFDAPVNYYASINFKGFKDAIDAMGGIALPIEEDIVNKGRDHEKFVIKGGQDLYNGTDALNYVRYREDAGGDMSRTGRHQIFINAMLDKASGVDQWTKIPELIDIMGENFSTDMSPDQIISLAKTLLQADSRTIYSHTLKGEGGRGKSNLWYFYADDEDLEQVKAIIDGWMDEKTTKAQLPLPEKYRPKNDNGSRTLSAPETAAP